MGVKNLKIGPLLLIVVALLVPFILRDEYFIHLLINAGLFYILVAGLNLLVGYLGKLSLGHTAFLGIGAYTTALLSVKLQAPFLATLAGSIVISLILSILFGIIVLRLRGPYFVIVSMCFAEVLAIVATNWVSLTNGPMGLPGVEPPRFFGYYLESKVAFYYLMVAIVIISTYIIYRLIHSVIGRASIRREPVALLAPDHQRAAGRPCLGNVTPGAELARLLVARLHRPAAAAALHRVRRASVRTGNHLRLDAGAARQQSADQQRTQRAHGFSPRESDAPTIIRGGT